jgi:hypothetical protein
MRGAFRWIGTSGLLLIPAFSQGHAAQDDAGVPDTWLEQVECELRAGEYRFSSLATELFSAPNRAQGLRSRVSLSGLEAFPRGFDASERARHGNSGSKRLAWLLPSQTMVAGPLVYIDQLFTPASGVVANHIASWDGPSWNALVTGVGGAYEMAVPDDGDGGALYSPVVPQRFQVLLHL